MKIFNSWKWEFWCQMNGQIWINFKYSLLIQLIEFQAHIIDAESLSSPACVVCKLVWPCRGHGNWGQINVIPSGKLTNRMDRVYLKALFAWNKKAWTQQMIISKACYWIKKMEFWQNTKPLPESMLTYYQLDNGVSSKPLITRLSFPCICY